MLPPSGRPTHMRLLRAVLKVAVRIKTFHSCSVKASLASDEHSASTVVAKQVAAVQISLASGDVVMRCFVFILLLL